MSGIEGLQPLHPRSVSDGQVRPMLMELLGIPALPEEPEVEVRTPSAEDGLRVSEFSFENLLGDPVPGRLCLPQAASPADPLPGVVCLPGTSASAGELAEAAFGTDPARGGRLIGWSRELARRGFATAAVTLAGCTARQTGTGDWGVLTRRLAPSRPFARGGDGGRGPEGRPGAGRHPPASIRPASASPASPSAARRPGSARRSTGGCGRRRPCAAASAAWPT